MIHRLRTSVVCIHDDMILGFDATDPTSGKDYFFLPGGKPEPGESLANCAIRETLEETGYKVRLTDSPAAVSKYPFHWDGSDYFCESHFYTGYLAENFSPPKSIQDASYHRGVTWAALSQLKELLNYHLEIQKTVLGMIPAALKG